MPRSHTSTKISAGRLRKPIRRIYDAHSEMATHLAWLGFAFLSLFLTTLLSTGAQLAPEMLEPGYMLVLTNEIVRGVSTGGRRTTYEY